MLTGLRRAILGIVAGALSIWIGVTQHRAWVYVVGVLLIAGVLSALVWVGWARWRGRGRAQWIVAAGVALVMAAPPVVLPWQAYHEQLPSQADWLLEASGLDQYVVGDRLYMRQLADLVVVDTESGEITAQIRVSGGAQASVGPAGDIYVLSETTVTAYDDAGTQLWRRPGRAVAATDETTVLYRCAAGGTSCVATGVDPATGAERWSRSLTIADEVWFEQPELPAPEAAGTSFLLPEVLVAEDPKGDGRFQVIDGDSGRPTQRVAADQVGVSGNVAVGLTLTAAGCVARGYRDGGEIWSTEPLAESCPIAVGLLDSRMYLRVGAADGDTVTVDLEDGSWRRCGQVELAVGEYDDDTHTGVGGDDVIVYRDGPGEVVAVDADSGDELWQHETGGSRPAGLSVGHGAVTVLTGADSHNPFVPEDVADGGLVAAVIDAGSGERTGSWIGAQVDDDTPIGTGRALVTADGQMWPIG